MNGFLGSSVLELAIGLIFVYLLLAIVCTATVEWIAGILSIRSHTLKAAISDLLGNQALSGEIGFLEAFYRHPLVAASVKEEHPAWLSPQTFSGAALDLLLARRPEAGKCIAECLLNLPEGEVKTVVEALIRKGETTLPGLQSGLEDWFDSAMHRASCGYQKKIRTWTLLAGAAISVVTNADTLQLFHTPGLLPGWSVGVPMNPFAWLARLTGWMLTIAAISLGAPFWFDTLNRVVNLRNAVTVPRKPGSSPQ